MPMMMAGYGGVPWSAPMASIVAVSFSAFFHVAVLPERLPPPETRETLPGKVTEIFASSKRVRYE